MKKKWYLGRLLAIGLLGGSLALFGCSGDDGKDGKDVDPGTVDNLQGQIDDLKGSLDMAGGVDSANVSLCYSCHQGDSVGSMNVDSLRAHMDNMGGVVYGEGIHEAVGGDGCVACHSGFRSGTSAIESATSNIAHQANRVAQTREGEIDNVVVGANGEITITFSIEDYRSFVAPTKVNAEFTIAKWIEERGSWVNMLQRSRGEGTIIRGANLRLDDPADKLTGERISKDKDITTYAEDGNNASQFTYTYTDTEGWWYHDGTNYVQLPAGDMDFSNGVLWRPEVDLTDDDPQPYEPYEPELYCGAEDEDCITYVQGIINDINAGGAWEDGTYRVAVTGRNRDDGYARFNVAGDFDLATGAVAGFGAAQPTSQITNESCTSCHGDRYFAFVSNGVHGNQRWDVNVCFNCHNDFTFDRKASVAAADGWVNISMANIVHKIHGGFEGYTVDGYEFENVAFPDWTLSGTANCTACHDGDVPAAGESWNIEVPAFADADVTTSSCATCHTAGGYLFDLADHANGATGSLPTTECAVCHGPTADEIHGVSNRLEQLRAQREDFSFELVSIQDAVYGATPVVEWQVVDANGDPIALTDAMIDGGPRLHIGWGVGNDWTNEGSGEKSTHGDRDNDDGGRPVALNVATTGDDANTVINGTIATTTFPAFTDDQAGQGHPFANLERAMEGRSGFVALHRRVYDEGETRLLTSLVQPIILGAGEVELADPRRNTIDHGEDAYRGGSCLSCHGTIAWHGGGYTADNNIQACITCHNAGSHKSLNVMGTEPPYSVDMMFLMHKIHSSDETMYPTEFSGRCHQCHVGSGSVAANVEANGVSNCNLCHDGEVHPGRIGVISDYPGAFDNYGLRGDGTDGE